MESLQKCLVFDIFDMLCVSTENFGRVTRSQHVTTSVLASKIYERDLKVQTHNNAKMLRYKHVNT